MSDTLGRAALTALLPTGPAWEPAADDDYELLLDGIGDNHEADRAALDVIRYVRDPWMTSMLADLEREYGIMPPPTMSEAVRRQVLATTMFRRSEPPTYELLQEKLDAAGFNCYVYANDPAVDPSLYLEQSFNMVCGGLLPDGSDAQCGEAEAICAQSGGELLVNGETYTQEPVYTCICGEDIAQCGEADAACGNYESMKLTPKYYAIPTDSGYWPLIFFVGGDRAWGLLGSRYSFMGCQAGANDLINSLVLQPDDKILIAGNLTSYNSTTRNCIARINPDGSLDGTFDPGTGPNSYIRTFALQADGKIIIGGYFTTYDGTARNHIARINSDGSLDGTFDPGTGSNGVIYSVIIQSDGKIIIGGYFTSYNGTAQNCIARLNSDGSLDTTFNPGSGANQLVYVIAIQTDGKIIIGGSFTSYNGTARNYIARINTDGSLDATFNPGSGTSNRIDSIAIQSDGKIIIGGPFTSYDGTARNRIARINSDGSLDATFDPGSGANDGIMTFALQADGKIIIGGFFTSYNGTTRTKIARVNIDGTLDATFDPGAGCNGPAYAVAIEPAGTVIIAGYFTTYNGETANRIARVNATGELDILDVYGWSISSAAIPSERRSEFRRLIIKHKPTASWAGLVVTYE